MGRYTKGNLEVSKWKVVLSDGIKLKLFNMNGEI